MEPLSPPSPPQELSSSGHRRRSEQRPYSILPLVPSPPLAVISTDFPNRANCPERGCRPCSPRRQRRIASSVLQLQSGLRSVACGSTLRTTPAPCTASIANPTQLSNTPFASSYYYRTDERWNRYPSNSQRTAIHANPDWPYAERQITRKWKCGGDCMSD